MKMTTAEAKELIDMIKTYSLEKQLEFPKKKGSIEFEVVGDKTGVDEFIVNIQRKGINGKGCSYQGRTKSNVILLRLDINPSGKHINPSDGKVIIGSHLHVYTEEYDIKEAILFNPESDDLYDVCYEFFKKFNIISDPLKEYQHTLDI